MKKFVLAIATSLLLLNGLSAQTTDSYTISNFASSNLFDDFIDWDSLQGYPIDKNEVGDANNPLDWKQAWIANDATDFYFAYSNYGDVGTRWGQTIYIDTDLNKLTGWQSGLQIGADYVIQGNSIFSYDGDAAGTVWQWNLVKNMGWSIFYDFYEFKFKRSLLGNPSSFRLAFVGSNEPYGGTAEDLYPDALYTKGSANPYFTYNVADGGNSAPTVEDALFGVRDGQSITFDLYGSDPDGDSLTYEITSDPEGGVVVGTSPTFTYTPDPGFTGDDFISYRAFDGELYSDEGFISLHVSLTGVNPVVYSNPMAQITVDGDLSEWSNSMEFPEDREGDIIFPNNPINYSNAGMAHNESSVFFYYENFVTDLNSIATWTHNIFLDTDADNTTGLQDGMAIGPDYLIQGADLFSYAGSGPDWKWSYVGSVVRAVQETQAEIMIDRAVLGNPEKINFALIGDNYSVGGNMADFYPDGIYNFLHGYRYFEYQLDDMQAADQNTLTIKAATADPIQGLPNTSVTAVQPFANRDRDTGTISVGGGGALGLVWTLWLLSFILMRRKSETI